MPGGLYRYAGNRSGMAGVVISGDPVKIYHSRHPGKDAGTQRQGWQQSLVAALAALGACRT